MSLLISTVICKMKRLAQVLSNSDSVIWTLGSKNIDFPTPATKRTIYPVCSVDNIFFCRSHLLRFCSRKSGPHLAVLETSADGDSPEEIRAFMIRNMFV